MFIFKFKSQGGGSKLLIASSVSDGLYKEMTALSTAKNIPITMHCAEVKADRDFLSHSPIRLCPIATPLDSLVQVQSLFIWSISMTPTSRDWLKQQPMGPLSNF